MTIPNNNMWMALVLAGLGAGGCAAATGDVATNLDTCEGLLCTPDAGRTEEPDPFVDGADAGAEAFLDVGTTDPAEDAGARQEDARQTPDVASTDDDVQSSDTGAEADVDQEARCESLDCANEACWEHPGCNQASETTCEDGLDNDRDGVPDCLDTDCFTTTPACHGDDRWESTDDTRESAPQYDDAGARPHRLCPGDVDWIEIPCDAVYALPYADRYERPLQFSFQGAAGIRVTARVCGEAGAPVSACREVALGMTDETGALRYTLTGFDADGELLDNAEAIGGIVCAMPGRPVHVALEADYSEASATRECAAGVMTAGEVPIVDPGEGDGVLELAPGEVYPESFFEVAPFSGAVPHDFDVMELPKVWPNDVDRIRVPIPRGRVCTTLRWASVPLSGWRFFDAELLAEDAVLVETADGTPISDLPVFSAAATELVPEHRYVRHCTERNNRARFIELDLAMLNDVALTYDPDTPSEGFEIGAGIGYWVWSTVERDIDRGDPENIAGLDAWEVRAGDETPLVEYPLAPGTWRYLVTAGEFGEFGTRMHETDYVIIEAQPGRQIDLLATPIEDLLERGMYREDMQIRVREVLDDGCDRCSGSCIDVRDEPVCAGRVQHTSARIAEGSESGAAVSFETDAADGVVRYLLEITADSDRSRFIPYDFTYRAH